MTCPRAIRHKNSARDKRKKKKKMKTNSSKQTMVLRMLSEQFRNVVMSQGCCDVACGGIRVWDDAPLSLSLSFIHIHTHTHTNLSLSSDSGECSFFFIISLSHVFFMIIHLFLVFFI